jgi:uncharacterized protein (TIGR00725 family)
MKKVTRKYQIAVIGSAGPEEYGFDKPDSKMYKAAEELGSLLAADNYIVINGGKGGIMLAVSKGAKSKGGIVAAETSGLDRFTSNEYVDVEIVTGDVGFRGPSQLIGMSDAVISLGGGAGTLQEICVAYRMQKPIVLVPGFGGWTDRLSNSEYLDERKLVKFQIARSPEEAVKMLNLKKAKTL